MMGFEFNGKHSYRDFGLIMQSKNRPILPEPKIVVEEIPDMDGEYDYSDVNPDGRTKYKPRNIEIDCSFKDRNIAHIIARGHQIAAWLACGEKQLIFDDESAVFYLGRVVNRLDLATQISKIGRFTLQFKCRPFAFSRVLSTEDIWFGQGLMFGYGYKLDMVPTSFAITGPVALNIYNPGTYVKPLIRITGSFTNISFSANGKTLTYNTPVSFSTVEIDCAKIEAVKAGSENVLSSITGDFIEFGNGNNTLQISGTGLSCMVDFIFNYLYL
ncbi:distal tail protein Dit [Petroclostridium sp. X23]|uniref:distal tail protein Dit n=1 Tax=Petroclostridium sp. X23 TaxID=3045146 RepID=UPI0024AD801E|nr:distal tail protein Dit [Petroclostridium sp. X23]WHH59171.1 phage tail family protein [Petroclostridium sp. X23]